MPTGSRPPTDPPVERPQRTLGIGRPPVSLVVPFSGDRGSAARTLVNLRRLELGDGDEIRVADNSSQGAFAALAVNGIVTVRATRERSSYHARNCAARGARGHWLLFCDADCIPVPRLLDAYFAVPPPGDCGILAGQIAGDQRQAGLIARYSRARNYLSQTDGLLGQSGAAAATANLLVRRAAFEAVGGFVEGIRSGGDIDFCWRVRAAGWRLEYRPAARVVHPHRDELAGFLRQVARYGAGSRWLDSRHPGTSPNWPLRPGLARSARDIAAHLFRGSIEEATFRAVDAIGLVAHNIGYRASNRA